MIDDDDLMEIRRESLSSAKMLAYSLLVLLTFLVLLILVVLL